MKITDFLTEFENNLRATLDANFKNQITTCLYALKEVYVSTQEINTKNIHDIKTMFFDKLNAFVENQHQLKSQPKIH